MLGGAIEEPNLSASKIGLPGIPLQTSLTSEIPAITLNASNGTR